MSNQTIYDITLSTYLRLPYIPHKASSNLEILFVVESLLCKLRLKFSIWVVVLLHYFRTRPSLFLYTLFLDYKVPFPFRHMCFRFKRTTHHYLNKTSHNYEAPIIIKVQSHKILVEYVIRSTVIIENSDHNDPSAKSTTKSQRIGYLSTLILRHFICNNKLN